jgi:hypothetical protein
MPVCLSALAFDLDQQLLEKGDAMAMPTAQIKAVKRNKKAMAMLTCTFQPNKL